MKNMLKILCLMVLLVSCATTHPNLFSDAKITKANDSIVVSENDLANLKERVNEYWGYRIANNYTKAFEYEDPKTKEKYNINLEEYLTSKSSLKYHSIRIVDIDFIRDDYAKMKVMVKYTFDFFEPITDEKDITEKWVKRDDGKWYRIFTTNIDQAPLEQ